jgi:hypothetical protein
MNNQNFGVSWNIHVCQEMTQHDEEATQSSIKNDIRNQVGIWEAYPIGTHTYHIV